MEPPLDVRTSMSAVTGAQNRRSLSIVHLFQGLPDRIVDRLAAAAVQTVRRKGERILAQGDDGDSLFCVVSGRVRIDGVGFAGREVFLNELGPGDCFGEIAVVDGLPRTAGATATKRTVLLALHRREFLDLLDNEPPLAVHLLGLFCERMRRSTDRYEESVFLSPPARLAKCILSLARHRGREVGGEIELRITQSELARFLGVSRKQINEHLRHWKDNSWVKVARARLFVTDAGALRQLAADPDASSKAFE